MLLGAFMLTSLAGAVEVTSDDGDTTLTLEGYYRLRVHHFSGLLHCTRSASFSPLLHEKVT